MYTIDDVRWFEGEMSPTGSGSLARRSVARDVWVFRRCSLAGGTMSLEVGFESLKPRPTSSLLSALCWWLKT